MIRAKHKDAVAVIDAPNRLRVARVVATEERLVLDLTDGVTVAIPLITLGAPWVGASRTQLANVRPRMGGTWLWWDDLGEGLVLDELLVTTFKLNPAVLLARRARGRPATPAKRAAARKNGAKGGRPKREKVSARAVAS